MRLTTVGVYGAAGSSAGDNFADGSTTGTEYGTASLVRKLLCANKVHEHTQIGNVRRNSRVGSIVNPRRLEGLDSLALLLILSGLEMPAATMCLIPQLVVTKISAKS
jgi:hypothetical protein